MRILIATDAWYPQINGVARTISTTVEYLKKFGHEVIVIEPSQFKTFSAPFYKEVPIAYNIRNIQKHIKEQDSFFLLLL